MPQITFANCNKRTVTAWVTTTSYRDVRSALDLARIHPAVHCAWYGLLGCPEFGLFRLRIKFKAGTLPVGKMALIEYMHDQFVRKANSDQRD